MMNTISNDDRDPFALARQSEGDAKIFALRAECDLLALDTAVLERQRTAILDRLCASREELMTTPAEALAGLEIQLLEFRLDLGLSHLPRSHWIPAREEPRRRRSSDRASFRCREAAHQQDRETPLAEGHGVRMMD